MGLASLPTCGFIAQLVRASHRYRGGQGSESRWSPDFFRLLLSNCLNWKIYCDDHSSLRSVYVTQNNQPLWSAVTCSLDPKRTSVELRQQYAWNWRVWLTCLHDYSLGRLQMFCLYIPSCTQLRAINYTILPSQMNDRVISNEWQHGSLAEYAYFSGPVSHVCRFSTPGILKILTV